MSESTNPMPFVCKWLDAHSKSQYFETVKELRKHCPICSYTRFDTPDTPVALSQHLINNHKDFTDSGEVYRDVLVKGTLIRMPPIRFKKGVDAISTLMEERIKEDFANYDPNNYDNLPEAPKDHLTEEERINFFGKQLVMYIKGQMLS
ncbi:10119_t:CDS:2 [Rhizophagus irregularis]|nr:10119_t:CDS:2 [Rhizophagus irregularis]